MIDNKLLSDCPDVMTIRDLQRALQIGRNTAYAIIRNNTIQSFKIMGQIRITKSAVLDFLCESCYNIDSNQCAAEERSINT